LSEDVGKKGRRKDEQSGTNDGRRRYFVDLGIFNLVASRDYIGALLSMELRG